MDDVPAPLSGWGPQASWLNRLRRFVLSTRLLPGNGYRLRQLTQGVILEIARPPGGGGSGVSVFRYVSGGPDYFNAHSFDGSKEGTTVVQIAKPYKLRNSNLSEVIDGTTVNYSLYDNTAQTRVATSSTATETHVIVPRYLVGDLIWAISPDVLGEDGVDLVGSTAALLDLNIDGRAWAVVNPGP